ncbi:MAG: NAD(P)/FAD-dependent oxidoreductase [Balneolaceae bacterium]|nr:NAD(P)/FAD-dependent oxidoreductase [Balneolaceae bacterium]
MSSDFTYDIIVAGSGMGGMSAATMLANDGFKVLVLEAAHALGGCSSSFYRKGYWFESGATTLTGFDENQPLWKLEKETGIEIPRVELNPSMRVQMNDTTITRYKAINKWIEEAGDKFGQPKAQRKFWKKALKVADVVWKASFNNPFFPPQNLGEWLKLGINNSLLDAWVLPYAFKSVKDVLGEFGLKDPLFLNFVDEQLMITAQSPAEDTPFLFGAPALTYTNYANYYVPGGLIRMVETLRDFITEKGGSVQTKEGVNQIIENGSEYTVITEKNRYRSKALVSNIPVWNMAGLTGGEMKEYFEKESKRFDKAWGAVTLGVVSEDTFPKGFPLHHQIHIPEAEKVPYIESGSIFVSLSHPDDKQRAKSGKRVLNVSCHTKPEPWFHKRDQYNEHKKLVEEKIIKLMDKYMPGFGKEHIINVFSGTPVTWQNWVHRKKGRVGGIPQSMARSLLDWTPASPPFENLYLCGDTVFPGQGIPGVTLSGINVYHRVKKNFN